MLTITPGGFLKVIDGDVTVSGTGTFGGLVVDTNTLVVDAVNNRVGIKTSAPGTDFDVNGDTRIRGVGGIDFWGGTASSRAQLKYQAWGTGAMSFEPVGASVVYKNSANTHTVLRICAGAVNQGAGFYLTDYVTDPTSAVNSMFGMLAYQTSGDQLAMFLDDTKTGHNLIITDIDNRSKNHDHGIQVNPTLWIHSDTDPDSDNTEWISFAHDQTNGVFGLGSGAYSFPNGRIGIGAITPTALLDINSDIFRLRTAKTPASAGAAGNAGDLCWDADYIYVCVAASTWKRAALVSW